jgi:hypothetical protein
MGHTASEERVMEDWREKYAGLSYAALGQIFLAQKEAIKQLADEKKALQAEHDFLRLTVIVEKMDEDEMSSINIKGVGRLGVTADAYVTVLAEHRDEFYDWLRENGHGGLIKPYAQPSTVKAFAKDLFMRDAQGEDGCELPEELISVEPFMRASVTKK